MMKAKIAVKFCGGCNPGYDRGAAYQEIRSATADHAVFSLPADGEHYDALLIIRGCTGCPYLYEEIDADTRIVCVRQDDISEVIQKIRNYETKE